MRNETLGNETLGLPRRLVGLGAPPGATFIGQYIFVWAANGAGSAAAVDASNPAILALPQDVQRSAANLAWQSATDTSLPSYETFTFQNTSGQPYQIYMECSQAVDGSKTFVSVYSLAPVSAQQPASAIMAPGWSRLPSAPPVIILGLVSNVGGQRVAAWLPPNNVLGSANGWSQVSTPTGIYGAVVRRANRQILSYWWYAYPRTAPVRVIPNVPIRVTPGHAGKARVRVGMGATPSALISAATYAIQAISADPCATTTSFVDAENRAAVTTFQNAFNAAGLGPVVAVTGNYDQPTAAALATVIAMAKVDAQPHPGVASVPYPFTVTTAPLACGAVPQQAQTVVLNPAQYQGIQGIQQPTLPPAAYQTTGSAGQPGQPIVTGPPVTPTTTTATATAPAADTTTPIVVGAGLLGIAGLAYYLGFL